MKTIIQKIVLIASFFLFYFGLAAQDIKYARQVINVLTSKEMAGRGYVNKGDLKAAKYIAHEFQKNKVLNFNGSFLQNFPINVNTYPKTMEISINGLPLLGGAAFTLANSPLSIKGNFDIFTVAKDILNDTLKLKVLFNSTLTGKFVLIDTLGISSMKCRKLISLMMEKNPFAATGIIEITSKTPMFSLSQVIDPYVYLRIIRNKLPANANKITVNIENKYLENVKTQNVIGYIRGETDSFIVFTAHYDHLGQMGKEAYFPGANDNSCGVAMVLDLARYYSSLPKKPKYSIAFMLFSGEELGLLGSFYYVENPLFPLNQIKFLHNLDVIGSGEDGIKIVNSEIFKPEYQLLVEINKDKNYVKSIQKRGAAANSDHYPFYEKKVRSFFIYGLGKYSEYHNSADKAEGLPLFAYENLFKLLTEWVERY